MRLTSLVLALTAVFIVSACAQRVSDVLADGTPHGWVVVEYRSDCPRAAASSLPLRHLTYGIPRSRYLCTSSNPPRGFTSWDYYLVASRDTRRRTRVDAGKLIHRQIHLQNGIVNGTAMPCRYEADAFYYGPEGSVSGDPFDLIRQYRQDCR